jgi:hypothetical protein
MGMITVSEVRGKKYVSLEVTLMGPLPDFPQTFVPQERLYFSSENRKKAVLTLLGFFPCEFIGRTVLYRVSDDGLWKLLKALKEETAYLTSKEISKLESAESYEQAVEILGEWFMMKSKKWGLIKRE